MPSNGFQRIRTALAIRSELARALIAEFLGTLILVMVVTCVVAQSILPIGGDPPLNKMINVNLGVGLAVTSGVAVSAKISGGHINPAVSLMFLTFGQLTALKFILYSLSQTAGAFFGALATYVVYRDAISSFDAVEMARYGTNVTMLTTAQIFASYPAEHLGIANGIIDQVVATALFCFLIAHITDAGSGYPSWAQPYLVGAALTTVGTSMALNSGYPCNPARDFGPRLFTLVVGYSMDVFRYNNYCWFWIPIVGPYLGALLGGWVYQAAIGFQLPSQSGYEAVEAQTREQKPPVSAK